MAKHSYAYFRAQRNRGQVNLTTDNLEAWLISSGYTPDYDNHKFFSSVSEAYRVAGPVPLENVTVSDLSVVDLDDFQFGPFTGGQGLYMLVVQRKTSDADSVLVVLEAGSTGLPSPSQTNGVVPVVIDDGPDKFWRDVDAA